MDKVLRGLSFATTYVDDILVHSTSEEEHKVHLRQVLQRLREAGLTLKGKKCHIGKTQVSYLGMCSLAQEWFLTLRRSRQ